jgi:acetyl-CoA/propionyl-CoA carboxylase biotin carboxyl carrier protein
MNTRLQVEHPVTELVTGIDIVEQQLRIAFGEPLQIGQADVTFNGHAVEARVYAEDPARGFLPTGGTPVLTRWPSDEGIRTDVGVMTGEAIGSIYDPMIAKIAAWGPDRDSSLARLAAALRGTAVLGVTTNVGFLAALVDHQDVRSGRLDTGLIEREMDSLLAGMPSPDDALRLCALLSLLELEDHGDAADLWDQPSSWRLGTRAAAEWPLNSDRDGEPVRVIVTGPSRAAMVRLGDGPAVPASATRTDVEVVATIDGVTSRWIVATRDDLTWLMHDGWVREIRPAAALVNQEGASASTGEVRSPMPGTVVAVTASVGDVLATGASIAVVEAMKMEHQIRSPHAGTVERITVSLGDPVALDALLAVVTGQLGGTDT